MAATLEHVLVAMRRYGIGIDCHSEFCECVVLIPTLDQKSVHKLSFNFLVKQHSILEAKQRCLQYLTLHDIHIDPKKLGYELESTGPYHMPIVRLWGGEPVIINPTLASQFKARKTDKWDAAMMAHQHLMGMWEVSHIPDHDTEMLRVLMRLRKRHQAHGGRCFKQINTRLTQWYVPLKAWKLSARDKSVRAAVEDLALGRPVNTDLVPGFGMADCAPAQLWPVLVELYRAADEGYKLASQLEKQAVQLATKKDSELLELLQTVPGVGRMTALTWMAEVEPSARFKNARRCAAFCGYDPTPMVSAGKVVSTRCRKGNGFIRSAVNQAANIVLTNNKSKIALWANAKMHKHRNVRVTAAGRKIVVKLYAVSQSRTAYDDLEEQYEQQKKGGSREQRNRQSGGGHADPADGYAEF